ncbi:MAG: 1-deoxy-D-xylulose-5-phosphate reductoisomerase [Candidatus Puniceispirillaceae bacterium]
MKKITILGATGTIGDNMLELMRRHRDIGCVYGISAHRNMAKLCDIITEFVPSVVALPEAPDDEAVARLCQEKHIELLVGQGAVEELARRNVDLVVAAIVGMAGLPSVMAAVKAGQCIALANKESLVSGGHIVMPALAEYGATILPVDSEHNAIYQCLMGQDVSKVDTVTLTASGGPFLGYDISDMRSVTKQDALAHPNWVMGAKVTIDSATLMNKGLELLEASHLFALSADKLAGIIHPQSLVHGLVEFQDGSVIAHLACADMKLPLGFALGLGERLETGTKRLNLASVGTLSFQPIDEEIFPCFSYARQIIDEGAEKSVILNAANEVAVEAFLADKIAFLQIPALVANALSHHFSCDVTTLEGVFDLDEQVRSYAAKQIASE